MTDIHLGYEVGSGEPVEIPLRHMVVTGQTQEAGKTTTLEALIQRSELPGIAFVTKRGEQSFAGGNHLQPYFRERADWQFVASVLEATMREKLKFERAWIMRASKGAKTLAEVQANVRTLMEKTKSGLNADVYMTLDEYLNIVVPRIAGVQFAKTMDLKPGLNVLNLANREIFPAELQALVMRSVIEWVYEHADSTITIIPEAWEFLPQGRGSPVKLQAIELIRKGAGLGNYVWLDSQDIGGVDKEMLRSCPVWLLGVQRETNEIKRTLDNIPAGIKKPKPADISKLKKGEFFACYGEHVIKTYVQPAWMDSPDAQHIAKGLYSVDDFKQPEASNQLPPFWQDEEEEMVMDLAFEKKFDEMIEVFKAVMGLHGQRIAALTDALKETGLAEHNPVRAAKGETAVPAMIDEEALYQRLKARLIEETPAILKVLKTVPEIHVETRVEVIELTDKTLRGRLAIMIKDGYFDEKVTGNAAFVTLKKTGFRTAKPNVYKECDNLTSMGFLIKDDGYEAVQSMKSNIKKTK